MFITEAYAQAAAPAAAQASSPYTTLIMLGVMFVLMYFLMIRPQQKRQKEHQKMIDAIGKGDEIIIAGGIYGYVTKAEEGGKLVVQIAEGVEVLVQRAAVAQVLPKGTINK